MKINQTSCVTMYSHVKLLVIHPVQRVTSLDDPVSSTSTQMMKPQSREDASAAETQLMRNIYVARDSRVSR